MLTSVIPNTIPQEPFVLLLKKKMKNNYWVWIFVFSQYSFVVMISHRATQEIIVFITAFFFLSLVPFLDEENQVYQEGKRQFKLTENVDIQRQGGDFEISFEIPLFYILPFFSSNYKYIYLYNERNKKVYQNTNMKREHLIRLKKMNIHSQQQ